MNQNRAIFSFRDLCKTRGGGTSPPKTALFSKAFCPVSQATRRRFHPFAEVYFLLAAGLGLFLASRAQAASLRLVTDDWGTNGVPSTVSMYIYVPDKVVANPPVLVLCHYCGGSAGGVFGEAYGGGIVPACDQYGFIMVVPQAVDNTYTNGRCWDIGSTNSLTRNGGGDTAAIIHMVNYTLAKYHANSNRVYVTGTSSGAMMTEALLALYPDVFKAGAGFSGVPAGGWAIDDPGGGWSGPCASGQATLAPLEWGNIVRAMSPGYSGRRPRIQLWHGTADSIISFTNQLEGVKEWSDVLGLNTNPTLTSTLTLPNITNQWTRQVWKDSSGNTVLDAWSEQNGPHGTDANFDAQQVIPFLGLNQAGPADPVISGNAPAGLAATAISSNQINLTWNAVANATSFNVKRSIISGGPYATIASGVTTTNYQDSNLSGGALTYYYVVSAVVGGGETPNSLQAAAAAPWTSQDVRTAVLAGSAAFGGGVFTVTGSGDDIWNGADAFQFCYLPVTGNCTIVARVASVQNTDPWAKAGVMIRESTNANAANAFVAVTPGNGVTWQYRASTGGSSGNNNTTGLSAPYWVKLVRSGNTFTGYRSPNGVTWTQQGTSQTFAMAATACVGLVVTAHNSSRLNTATFDNVIAPGWPTSFPPPAPADLAASAGNTLAGLNWLASSNAIGYNVKRSTASGGPYTVVANVAATNYSDVGLTNGTTYYYVVSAQNLAGESTNSAQVGVTPVPSINVAWMSGNLTLAWPLASAGFTLQLCTNLASGNWLNVTSPSPQMIGNQWQVTLPPATNCPAFYRLSM